MTVIFLDGDGVDDVGPVLRRDAQFGTVFFVGVPSFVDVPSFGVGAGLWSV